MSHVTAMTVVIINLASQSSDVVLVSKLFPGFET